MQQTKPDINKRRRRNKKGKTKQNPTSIQDVAGYHEEFCSAQDEESALRIPELAA